MATTVAEIPVGQPNCLAGLTFVFTVNPHTLNGWQAEQLIQQYGRNVVSSMVLTKGIDFALMGKETSPGTYELLEKEEIKRIAQIQQFHLVRNMPANGNNVLKRRRRRGNAGSTCPEETKGH